MNFSVSKDRVEKVKKTRKFRRQNQSLQELHLKAFAELDTNKVYKSQEDFISDLKEAYCKLAMPPVPYLDFVMELGEDD